MAILLFFATMVAGALNAVAGGGGFITLPVLLYAGVSPVSANATGTFAVWPASVASAVAYRHDIGGRLRGVIRLLGAASLVGGLIGGLLLVETSDVTFVRLLPWLMLLAAATFTFGGAIAARLPRADGQAFSILAVLVQLLIATYGGYFGGGMGIMMLATFAVAGMTDIHEMNGVKAVLAAAINGVALVTFVLHGEIVWRPGLIMMAGGIIGGYFGATAARRLDRGLVRTFVIVVGWGMTAYFFLR